MTPLLIVLYGLVGLLLLVGILFGLMLWGWYRYVTFLKKRRAEIDKCA